MATEIAKDAIALEIASGQSPATVAKAHSYTQGGLASLLKTADMQAKVAEHREILAFGAVQLVAKTWVAAGDSIDNIINIANDVTNKEQLKANMYLVDKVWPTKQVTEEKVTLSIDPESQKQLIAGIKELKTLRSAVDTVTLSDDPHLINGEDAKFYTLPTEVTLSDDGPRTDLYKGQDNPDRNGESE